MEGKLEFSSILFIPKTAPFAMFEKEKKNIKLYVKKVLITDNCPDLFPEYFNFIKGVVDCSDLPLNASRELLQQGKYIKQISKILIEKTIKMFTELATNNEEYEIFYDQFSKNIKLAIHEDTQNKDKLLDLVRFPTSLSESKNVSLSSYIDRMQNNQAGIYYINSDSLINASNSPLIEKLKNLNMEIIYMCDTIDEYIMQNIKTYKDKKFINVISDDLKLTNNSETKSETEKKLNDEICSKIKKVLSNHISEVIISDKLESQPAIVTCNMGISANMERIINAQAFGNNLFKSRSSNKVLEINPKHKLIKNVVSKSYDENYLMIIYYMALLAGGFQLENMNDFLIKLYDFVEANDGLPSKPNSSNAQILETVSCTNESCDNKSCYNESCDKESSDNKSCDKESCTN